MNLAWLNQKIGKDSLKSEDFTKKDLRSGTVMIQLIHVSESLSITSASILLLPLSEVTFTTAGCVGMCISLLQGDHCLYGVSATRMVWTTLLFLVFPDT